MQLAEWRKKDENEHCLVLIETGLVLGSAEMASSMYIGRHTDPFTFWYARHYKEGLLGEYMGLEAAKKAVLKANGVEG